ncbi:hypothetical protein N0V83_002463 [Neocucurbitaria cava]|uniref:Uncharacterized protein n=1 Tax=Neocucurbitaria cava TaxID=798079 RepID=A0A9W8YHJ1_9PLEO|nr:hypothetical protein N0V83_002463 [Neocucurbitaria cava]
MTSQGYRKLEFRTRRMACAYTHDGDDVWVTFLKRNKSLAPGKIARMYLHTAPKLNHTAANLTVDDIDFATTSPQLGKYVIKYTFHDIALAVWSWYGDDLELKTWEELEGRCTVEAGYESDCSETSDKHRHRLESRTGFDHNEQDNNSNTTTDTLTTIPKEMTLDEAIDIQNDSFNGKDVDEDQLALSFEEHGHIKADQFTDLAAAYTDGGAVAEQNSPRASSKRSRASDDDEGSSSPMNKRARLDSEESELGDGSKTWMECTGSLGMTVEQDHGHERQAVDLEKRAELLGLPMSWWYDLEDSCRL